MTKHPHDCHAADDHHELVAKHSSQHHHNHHKHHDSHHSHSHGHHHHVPKNFNRAFVIAIIANFSFTVIEALLAWRANSTSLLADAGHNLGDVCSLLLAFAANWLLTKPSTQRYSYGFKRTSIIAALINALVLILTSLGIAYQAITKLVSSSPVNEKMVIVVALLGIIVNGSTALLFMRGQKTDLNIKGAFLHLAYDALISLGVVLAGWLILITGWQWLDPIVGLLIMFTIVLGTWSLLRDSVNLILDGVPPHVDPHAVKKFFAEIPGVTAVHELHIWGLSTNEVALTVHVVMPEQRFSDADYRQINHELTAQFGIHHVTIQVETGNLTADCALGMVCCDKQGNIE